MMDAAFKGLLGAIGMILAIFIFKAIAGLFSKTVNTLKKVTTPKPGRHLIDDERLYEIAATEVDEKRQKYGLWEKSLVIANGDFGIGRREYIKLRVLQLKDENPPENVKPS
ncbi:hypothetical protein SCT_3209 [Sulfuricella sp. T08]|uniref:hypothetical protein n=1 Tax=Sulfuricella sp. T08 TaxID=1632857 RepID=UPI0006179644|nr:hypothetical protein [Sulfuricella sp. T08]GAO37772.1 hypothetical protein SCT_3209 [Sulfuricella sp. T08]